MLEKSCLIYSRVETILKKPPRNRRLAWLGVNPDLSRLQKKCVSKKSVYWLHDTVGPEGSNNWRFLPLACWKSAFILHVKEFTNLHKVNGLKRCLQWKILWIFCQTDRDSVSALECEWTLYTVGNECVNTSLDKKKMTLGRPVSQKFLEHFAYYSGAHSIIYHISTVSTGFDTFCFWG